MSRCDEVCLYAGPRNINRTLQFNEGQSQSVPFFRRESSFSTVDTFISAYLEYTNQPLMCPKADSVQASWLDTLAKYFHFLKDTMLISLVSPEHMLMNCYLVVFCDSICRTALITCLHELDTLIPWARSLCKTSDTIVEARFTVYTAKCTEWRKYGGYLKKVRVTTKTRAFEMHVLVQKMDLDKFRVNVHLHCLQYLDSMRDKLSAFLAASSHQDRLRLQLTRADREKLCALWLTLFNVDVRPQRECNLRQLTLSDVQALLTGDASNVVKHQAKRSVKGDMDCFFLRRVTTEVAKDHRDLIRPVLIKHGPSGHNGKLEQLGVGSELSTMRVARLAEILNLSRVAWGLLKRKYQDQETSEGPRAVNKWTLIYGKLDPEPNKDHEPWGLPSPSALQAKFQQINAQNQAWIVGPCGEGTQGRSVRRGFVTLVYEATGMKLRGFTDFRAIVASFLGRNGSESSMRASNTMLGHTGGVSEAHYQACDWHHTTTVWSSVYPDIISEPSSDVGALEADEEEETADALVTEDDRDVLEESEDEDVTVEEQKEMDALRAICSDRPRGASSRRQTPVSPLPETGTVHRWTMEELETQVQCV